LDWTVDTAEEKAMGQLQAPTSYKSVSDRKEGLTGKERNQTKILNRLKV